MFSCRTMLSSAFPPAKTALAHGCPFKELNGLKLQTSVKSDFSVQNPRDIEDIMAFSRNGEYQRACVKTFESLYNGVDSAGVGNAPIEFYKIASKALAN